MRCKFKAAFLVAATFDLLLSGSTFAQIGQLDQINAPPFGSFGMDVGVSIWGLPEDTAQTFTVGLPGTLSQVDLSLFHLNENDFGPIQVDICRVSNTTGPDFSSSGILASKLIEFSKVPVVPTPDPQIDSDSMVSVDFLDAHIAVQPGDVFGILLRSTPNYFHYESGKFGNRYAGRLYRLRYDPGTGPFLDEDLQHDFLFRTFVLVTPEPTAIVLAAMAFSSAVVFVRSCSLRSRRH